MPGFLHFGALLKPNSDVMARLRDAGNVDDLNSLSIGEIRRASLLRFDGETRRCTVGWRRMVRVRALRAGSGSQVAPISPSCRLRQYRIAASRR
jgi:hypothetical protein